MRKQGDLVLVKLGDLPSVDPALADVRVKIKHIGPGKKRSWSFDLQRIRDQARKRQGAKFTPEGDVILSVDDIDALSRLAIDIAAECVVAIEGLAWEVKDIPAEVERLAIAEDLLAPMLDAQNLTEPERLLSRAG